MKMKWKMKMTEILSQTIWNKYQSQYMTRSELIEYIEWIRLEGRNLEIENANLKRQNQKLVKALDTACMNENDSQATITALQKELSNADEIADDPDHALQVLGDR